MCTIASARVPRSGTPGDLKAMSTLSHDGNSATPCKSPAPRIITSHWSSFSASHAVARLPAWLDASPSSVTSSFLRDASEGKTDATHVTHCSVPITSSKWVSPQLASTATTPSTTWSAPSSHVSRSTRWRSEAPLSAVTAPAIPIFPRCLISKSALRSDCGKALPQKSERPRELPTANRSEFKLLNALVAFHALPARRPSTRRSSTRRFK
mmetsp:Transcript_21420/g.47016  ORF Transcript_21420/g.47016 Transcript_21420/m.47016 type:complete len:210 (+) Transcript_21420:859-1488(+)